MGCGAALKPAAPVQSPALCIRTGCGKPSWNGQPGEYCSVSCKDSAQSFAVEDKIPAAVCLLPGCGKPTFDGSPNKYCSKSCKGLAEQVSRPQEDKDDSAHVDAILSPGDSGSAPQVNDGQLTVAADLCEDDSDEQPLSSIHTCARPGCEKPTWNGQPGFFCSRACKAGKALIVLPDDVQELVKISDDEVIAQFTQLLRATHKVTDNWTRDRGCSRHGRNNCADSCIMEHHAAVPSGYKVVSVERNNNTALRRSYEHTRSAIVEECKSSDGYREHAIASSAPAFQDLGKNAGVAPLVDGCNEWFLFHGAPREALESICAKNFQVNMAGSGATLKKGGKAKRPLYGWGVYFAEMITKADEYARSSGGVLGATFSVLVCRVVGGNAHMIQEDTINERALKSAIIHGQHHSLIGDRVTQLGKPYREMVVYSSDQIYPEFIVTYKRM